MPGTASACSQHSGLYSTPGGCTLLLQATITGPLGAAWKQMSQPVLPRVGLKQENLGAGLTSRPGCSTLTTQGHL